MRYFATSKCSHRIFFQLTSSSLLLILTFLLTFRLLFAEIALKVSSSAGETPNNFLNQKFLLQNPSKIVAFDIFPQKNLPTTQEKTTLISHKFASSAAHPPPRQHLRHRRRIPTGIISKLIAKLTGKTGKVATTASRSDDVFVGAGKVERIPIRGKAPDRYYKPRGFDPPPFGSYALPAGNDLAKRARTKALTGANVALAAAGVGTGIWYFGGENAVLYILLIIGGVLVVLILALLLLFYLFLCQKRKKGYYAVNEQMASALAKKVLFYLFC